MFNICTCIASWLWKICSFFFLFFFIFLEIWNICSFFYFVHQSDNHNPINRRPFSTLFHPTPTPFPLLYPFPPKYPHHEVHSHRNEKENMRSGWTVELYGTLVVVWMNELNWRREWTWRTRLEDHKHKSIWQVECEVWSLHKGFGTWDLGLGFGYRIWVWDLILGIRLDPDICNLLREHLMSFKTILLFRFAFSYAFLCLIL